MSCGSCSSSGSASRPNATTAATPGSEQAPPLSGGGFAGAGISTGSSGGGRRAFHTADARQYQGYRPDVTLDIRQMEVALRRLRAFVREGAEQELDIDATIDRPHATPARSR